MTARLIVAVGLTSLLLLATGCAPDTGGLTRPPIDTIYSAALVRYDCPGGTPIQVSYPDHKTAVVVYENREHRMTIARSADGARYVGDQLEWWSKGSGSGSHATLFAHDSNGKTGAVIEQCRQVSLEQ